MSVGEFERFEQSRELFERARERMAAGALEEAVSSFRESAALEPHFKTLELLGECLGRLGRWREAVVPLAAATTLNGQVRAPALLAEAFLQLGDYVEATEFAEMALARDPANQLALRVRAAAAEHVPRDA